MKNVDAKAKEVNYPEPRMAVRPEADSGDEDRSAAVFADVRRSYFLTLHQGAWVLSSPTTRKYPVYR